MSVARKKSEPVPAEVPKKKPLYWEAVVAIKCPRRVKEREKLGRIAQKHGFLFEYNDPMVVHLTFVTAVVDRASQTLEEFCKDIVADRFEILRYRYGEIYMDSNTFDVLKVMEEDQYADH